MLSCPFLQQIHPDISCACVASSSPQELVCRRRHRCECIRSTKGFQYSGAMEMCDSLSTFPAAGSWLPHLPLMCHNSSATASLAWAGLTCGLWGKDMSCGPSWPVPSLLALSTSVFSALSEAFCYKFQWNEKQFQWNERTWQTGQPEDECPLPNRRKHSSSACKWGHCYGQHWAGPAGISIPGAWGCTQLCIEEFVTEGVTQTLVLTQGSWILLYSPLISKHTSWTASLNIPHQSVPLQELHMELSWAEGKDNRKQWWHTRCSAPYGWHLDCSRAIPLKPGRQQSSMDTQQKMSPGIDKQLPAGLARLRAGLSEEEPHHVTQIFLLSSSHFTPLELSPPGTHGEDEQTSFALSGLRFGGFFEPSMRNYSCGCLTHLLPCCYIYKRFLSPGSVWDLSHLSKRRRIQHCHMIEVEGEGGRSPGDTAYITFTSWHMPLRVGKEL